MITICIDRFSAINIQGSTSATLKFPQSFLIYRSNNLLFNNGGQWWLYIIGIYGVHFVLLLVAEVVAIADNNKLKN